MSSAPLAAVRGALVAVWLALATVTLTLVMMPLALVKLLVPAEGARRVVDRMIAGLATAWVAGNNAWLALVSPQPWDVRGLEGLRPRGWYLVSSNHQSWVDILVLQRVFHGRIPFLKFFLKRELIWVPVIGLAWWALDFPFMKRGSGRNARASDLATTRAACQKFKRIPTSVINFVEGTRFTDAKRAEQKSPYRHLLKPKLGGLGIALATMGDQFEAMLDVTIVYPHGTPTFWQLLSGRVETVTVRVQPRDIPEALRGGDPLGDKAHRDQVGAWINAQWAEKDALIDRLTAGSPQRAAG